MHTTAGRFLSSEQQWLKYKADLDEGLAILQCVSGLNLACWCVVFGAVLSLYFHIKNGGQHLFFSYCFLALTVLTNFKILFIYLAEVLWMRKAIRTRVTESKPVYQSCELIEDTSFCDDESKKLL